MIMDNVLTFGKYKGNKVEVIMETDPNYLLWANENVSFFSLTNEQLQICKKKKEQKLTRGHWVLTEEGKEEYQYFNKIKKEHRNKENYSPRNYYYENIDEWESLAW